MICPTIGAVDEATSGPPGRWQVEPETRALRTLQTAMTDAETALARRMRLGQTDMAAMTHLASARQPVGPGWLSARWASPRPRPPSWSTGSRRWGTSSAKRDRSDRRRVNLIPTASSLMEVNDHLRPLLDAVDAVAEEFTDHERAAILRFLAEVSAIYEDFSTRT